MKKPNLRPRIMLPRNLVVTKVKPNAKGKGTYNRQKSKLDTNSNLV